MLYARNSQCARYAHTLGRQIEQSTTLFYLRGRYTVEASRLVYVQFKRSSATSVGSNDHNGHTNARLACVVKVTGSRGDAIKISRPGPTSHCD